MWAGYPEPPQAEDESEDEARERLEIILRETEVLLTNPIVPDNVVDRAPALKWLQLTSAGVDRLLDAPVVRSSVSVTTASGIHAVPISEYVVGAILAFAKGFPQAQIAKRERAWRPFWPQEVEAKTVGILGMGAIGARVAMLCRALGMRVLAMRRSAEGRRKGEGDVDELFGPGELAYVLAQSDYVVVAVPLTAETRGMIGEAELRGDEEQRRDHQHRPWRSDRRRGAGARVAGGLDRRGGSRRVPAGAAVSGERAVGTGQRDPDAAHQRRDAALHGARGGACSATTCAATSRASLCGTSSSRGGVTKRRGLRGR